VRAAAKRLAIAAAAGWWPAVVVGCPAAAAGSAQHVPVARNAWFYTPVTDQVGAPVPLPVTEPTGVPHGDDAVAFTTDQSGASSKQTLIQFALPKATAGATIGSFTVSLTLESSPSAPQAAAAGAPIVACLPTRGWTAGEAQNASGEPTVNCDHAVAGSWKGNTISFEVSKLAQSWVDDTNLGLALVNDPKNKTQPFQAVFARKAVHAAMRYTPAGTTTTTSQHHHHPLAGHTPDPTQQHSGGAGGGSSNSAIPPVPHVNPPPDSATTTTSGPASQPPVVAPSGTGTTARPVASSPVAHLSHSALPPNGFWAGAAILLLVVVGAGLALEERSTRLPAAPRSRLDRVLRDPARLAALTTRSQS
jgi:hypothetical protein